MSGYSHLAEIGPTGIEGVGGSLRTAIGFVELLNPPAEPGPPKRRKVYSGGRGREMKSTVVETFLLGVAFGIGITILLVYTKTRPLSHFDRTMAEMRRTRRAKEQEKKLQRERLKAVGFSDDEIDEFPP